MLREPAAPSFHHQIIVGRIFKRLDAHVRRGHLGEVVLAPVDVVLDREHALIVQPDVVFISVERAAICTDRIWGAPDLTVEVLSKARRRHDSVVKVKWYRQYGVRECWLVDPVSRQVNVIDLGAPEGGEIAVEAQDRVRSQVLPRLRLRPADIFDA